MDKNFDYEALLDRLVTNLPDVVKQDIRFEPPRANSAIQGNRTIIYNFNEIVHVLHRPPQHLLKYLLKELGTAGEIDGHRVVLQGRFPDIVVNNRVSNYIKEYVLCPECGKPDTQIIKEERVRVMKCLACGARHPIRNI